MKRKQWFWKFRSISYAQLIYSHFRPLNASDEVNKTTSINKNGTRSQDENLTSSSTSSASDQDEVLDCGKAVNFTYYDNLVGVNNRHNHPHVPEPQVALIFKKKSSKNSDFDVDALERKLKKAKREVCLIIFF